MKQYYVTLLNCLISMAVLAQNYDTVKILPIKLTDQIYMLKGAGGNMGLLIGPDGNLLIDNQFAPLSIKIQNSIKSIDPAGSVKYMLNTHIHGDHSGGNENFKRAGAILIAHDNVRERMTKEQVNKTINRVTPPREKDALPLITFPDRMRMHLNGEDIELIHMNPAHTDGDVIIHFKNSNIFHSGDVFVRYGFPFIDVSSGGSINGFITALDKFLPMLNEQSRIIPGHGEMATKADVKLFRDRLADIRDKVAAALKRGTKPVDIPALGITDIYDAEWGKGFIKGRDFVMIIVESLKQ